MILFTIKLILAQKKRLVKSNIYTSLPKFSCKITKHLTTGKIYFKIKGDMLV